MAGRRALLIPPRPPSLPLPLGILRAERAGLKLGRGTIALGAVATAATLATIGLEIARVWRRGSAPLPGETHDLLAAGRTAAGETVDVFREGYRTGTARENALFNLFASFALTFGTVRGTTALIRAGHGGGLLRNVVLADRHIHHFVPGFLLVAGAGGVAITMRSDHFDRWLAIPFGAGAALVLDEAALLLELDDVYWTEEGVLSLQLSFGATAVLAALVIGVRLLRRGEPIVLDGEDDGDRTAAVMVHPVHDEELEPR